tara:strand:- start:51 stop:743 length:693 start_codon:yes stop_codon:yes gene_type:complete
MKNLLKLILLLTLVTTYSQNTVNINTYSSLNGESGLGNNTSGGIWVNKPVYNDIQGDSYLLNNWMSTMTIYTNQNKTFNIFNSNLDLLKNKFVSKVSNDSIFEYDNRNIKYVNLNNVIYKRYVIEDKDQFLAVIFNGKNASFLKKNSIFIDRGIVNPMTLKKMSEDKYVTKSKYFAYINGNIQEFRLSKGRVLSVLKDKKNMLKKFVKDNKLTYKTEEDILQIFKYYNSL